MILPLQTWQHQDPKGLWPAIGGLAVLAHIGVIGMSVPYLLSLREAEAQNAATAIPIELSVAESENSALAETPTIQNDQSAVQDSQEVGESAIASNQKAGSSARSHTSKSSTVSPTVESPSTPKRTSEQLDNTTAPQATSNENEAGEAIEDSETPEIPETPETPEITTEGSSQSSDNSPVGPLPTVEGEDLSAPSTNTEVGQSLQIRVVGAPQSVPVEDFITAPPELINPGYVGLLRSDAEGCGTISALATQSPLVYRIGVRLDGTIADANLYGNQPIEPDSADDKAVVCLIKKTGITFRRTVSGENDKPIDDRLLVTFELSEQ